MAKIELETGLSADCQKRIHAKLEFHGLIFATHERLKITRIVLNIEKIVSLLVGKVTLEELRKANTPISEGTRNCHCLTTTNKFAIGHTARGGGGMPYGGVAVCPKHPKKTP